MSQARSSPAQLEVRPMRGGDLQRVAEIEQRGYAFPWSEGIFKDCLRAGYSCWVLEAGNCVAGYAVLSVAAGESHVLNICIDPVWQRLGLGAELMNHLMARARDRGAGRMILEVRPSNRPARQLYEQLGFQEVGLRRGYYPGRGGFREDALVLARSLQLPGGEDSGGEGSGADGEGP